MTSSRHAPSFPSGATRWTMPRASASGPANVMPPRRRGAARPGPSRRTTYGEMTAGTRPSRASGVPNRAVSAATTKSLATASPNPPPMAAPWTEAITGVGKAAAVRNSRAKRRASSRLASSPAWPEARIAARSAPAQNTVPSPSSTTSRHASGARSRSRSSRSGMPSTIAGVSAFRASGRRRTRRHTPRGRGSRWRWGVGESRFMARTPKRRPGKRLGPRGRSWRAGRRGSGPGGAADPAPASSPADRGAGSACPRRRAPARG